MKKLLPYILLVLLAAACDSEDAWDILKTKGDSKTETRSLTAFTGVTIYNGINVVLEKANRYEAVLDSWTNLLPKITLSVDSDGMLTIKDENKFDFMRNPNNMTTIRLYYDGEINTITSHNNGIVTTADTLRTSHLTILSEDASGNIELVIKTSSIAIGTNNRNVGDIKLDGVSTHLDITNWGNAPINASKLDATYCSVTHRGSNDLYLNVASTLEANIHSIGNIYYKGNPTVSTNHYGKGNIYAIP